MAESPGRGGELGDRYLIKGKSPPYYASMSEAVDEVVRLKFGQGGVYKDSELFNQIYKEDYGRRYLEEAREYGPDVIDCVRDICNYIYQTHGRFPAHVDAIHVPGVWIQVHHPDLHYYERFFRNGLTDAQRSHQQLWH